LIQVVNAKLALIFHLGVVIEHTFYPETRLRLLRFGPKFLNDAGNANELYFVGIAHDRFIKQHFAWRVIMAVNEPWHDGHAASVNGLGTLAAPSFCLFICADGDEASIFHGKRLCIGHSGINRVHISVPHDKVGVP
jgi:hypothetical protein